MNERERAMLDGRVKYYTQTTVTIGFPENRVCCAFCPLLETYARKQCRRTGEYITDERANGYFCPLKIIEEMKEE